MIKLESNHTSREYYFSWKTPQGVKPYTLSITCRKEDIGLIGVKGLMDLLTNRVKEYCKEKGIRL